MREIFNILIHVLLPISPIYMYRITKLIDILFIVHIIYTIESGVTPQDKWEALYDRLVYATEHVHPEHNSTGRYGHEYYNELGYVPYNVGIHENVARTLEYAYDD